VGSSSRIALACTSLCLAVSATGAQSVRQCPLSERQAAFARPVVATGLVAALRLSPGVRGISWYR